MSKLDTNNVVNLNNLVNELNLSGEWYTEQTYICVPKSHKVYTFDEYGKTYSILYIYGAFRLVDDENGEHHERYNIDNFKRLLLNIVY